jgi:hypothetical protein
MPAREAINEAKNESKGPEGNDGSVRQAPVSAMEVNFPNNIAKFGKRTNPLLYMFNNDRRWLESDPGNENIIQNPIAKATGLPRLLSQPGGWPRRKAVIVVPPNVPIMHATKTWGCGP